ncbi:MAG TPA: hypothetical protein VJ732_08445 [Bryobacteraceae bacterium]|nr:hypothetical protein [Bryobacteraceae bacterium]
MGWRIWLALWTLILAHAARASEADALAISQNIQARHFPYFTVLDPIFDSPTGNQVTGYTRCGDSALWTGLYLAAEAFRYSVTHSPDALADARRAFDGIQSLVDVTGNNVLARCLAPDDSPYAAGIQSEEAANGIYHSAPGNFWVGNTSRDQYSGVIFGLGVAYDLIDDAALRSSIAAVVTRLVRFLEDHWWSVVLPDGTETTTFLYRPEQQLAFLQLARHVNPSQFSTSYDLNRVLLAPLAAVPIGVDTLSDGSYFKFNLDTVNLYTLIRLESSTFGDVYRQAYQILRDHTAGQANAFFNMVDRALRGPDTARDADTARFLDEWLQRPRRDLFVDSRGKYPSCGDTNTACQPIPIPDRITTDFLWQRSPYQLANLGGDNLIEGAGIDYILPYWMARYYGVIGPDHLRIGSAASGEATLAAEEIASIFGLNLAVSAASAAADTTSLEGVSVTVKDSAAASRPAALYYVSPGQVNFVVPAGTAPGTASFTVHSAGAADVTVSAPIATVAPGLFAADGSGTGVAAATAIRVVAGRQSPVAVFSCAGTSCSAAPIELGVDTPVFLTLYGTGIRHRSSAANVTCTIGGLPAPVTYAGPQLQYPGLDQVNAALPLSLRGLGPVTVTVTVDGQASNPVSIDVQ